MRFERYGSDSFPPPEETTPQSWLEASVMNQSRNRIESIPAFRMAASWLRPKRPLPKIGVVGHDAGAAVQVTAQQVRVCVRNAD